MRHFLKDTWLLWLTTFLLASSAPVYAQQPSPQDELVQTKAMVSTLYRQLNTAIQDGAQQEAGRVKLQQEVERLKAQLAEGQKLALEPHPGKGKGDAKDTPAATTKDSD